MGRPKAEDTEKKATVLQAIRDKKGILFGQFSSDLEKSDIESAWEDILKLAKSIAVVPEKTTTAILRRLFSQWKSRTLEKKTNKGKTGTGGGKQCKLTEIDNLILDILGRDSPVVTGLSVGESGDYQDADVVLDDTVVFNETEVHEVLLDDEGPIAGSSNSDMATGGPVEEFPVRTKKRKISHFNSEKDVLLEEKWKAQTELIKQQAYNLQLQNYKLEVDLGLLPSDLTKALHSQPIATSTI